MAVPLPPIQSDHDRDAFHTWIDEWADRGPFYLTNATFGLASPESAESPGALWISDVRDTILHIPADFQVENLADMIDDLDRWGMIDEAVDGMVPIYNYELWSVWVDLGGWAWDSEMAPVPDADGDLTPVAQRHLFEMADRLTRTMLADLAERARNNT
jgi:hypothetical protein